MLKIRYLIFIFLPLIVAILLLVSYYLQNSDIQDIIICSTDDSASYIPKSICKSYFYSFRGTSDDIAQLESSSGVMIAFDIKDQTQRKPLFNFLIQKGININKINNLTGLSPLHEAVLRNDLTAINLLLSYNANPTIKDQNYGLNSLEFTRKLIKQNPNIDRKPIEVALSNLHLQTE